MSKKFAESVAPAQADKLLCGLMEDENDEGLPNDLDYVLNLYNKSDSVGQLIILSLTDPKKYTKQKILETFNCSKYKIEQARKWNAINSGLVLPTKVQFKRNNINVSKCEHFLDFVFMSGLLHDVAYGVTKIKYDSGEKQKVAHAVLTAKYSHAISFYLQSCSINGLLFVYFTSQSDFQYCNSNCKIKKKNVFIFNLV